MAKLNNAHIKHVAWLRAWRQQWQHQQHVS